MGLNAYRLIENVTFLALTIIGLLHGQVSVFYIIYLFWCQELIRIIIDSIVGKQQNHRMEKTASSGKSMLHNMLFLFFYFIFIVVFFGIVLVFNNYKILTLNLLVLSFRNFYFNLSLILFTIEYALYQRRSKDKIDTHAFSMRMVILHISIVLGIFIHLFSTDSLGWNDQWTAILSASPFLLLKLLLNGNRKLRTIEKND